MAYQGCLLEDFTPYTVRFCKVPNHTFRFLRKFASLKVQLAAAS